MTTNADQAELDRFNALAQRWWDPQGPMAPLHAITPLRMDYVQQTRPVRGLRVADIGCGGGLMAEAMTRAGAQVTAIDLSSDLLGAARLHAEDAGLDIDYRDTSAEALAAELPGAFDLITCFEMLEHVPAPAAIVQACRQLARPDGEVLFSTINRNAKAFAFAIVGAEYVLGLVPRGTHQYEKLIRPAELAGWCRTNRLEVQQMTGLVYNPLTQVYRLHDSDVSVNYFMRTRPAE
ncbi:bifunctional 2-polyprenyl-6-hydroxyphenol methylase/3-demethylubiquinol 3-O-methyltransferase UbiG [Abyssibacter profundi]|uniref:Ubiquinone biosynthesis O-methyltransferase n=1 Tax=Abyssibacter profundi TaxID=2182787 RepID=A0A363UMY5_9GAMM|nr:bifunctional 2-polyprenyl-6-hydroxyphenol methylase/3-demethylubiquinol 3-O-methyltransferase UbiG [Abyssibacter profundi]PWN56805.1 bifunctional 3-demethylubiquinol 3-O-methyltransferase/2-polyprenyl-6-hydroxyphenol methylase [Abyssibacter profundi]